MYATWDRATLKARAKQVLKGNYWKAFIVSIVLALVSGGIGSGANSGINASGRYNSEVSVNEQYNNETGTVDEVATSRAIKWTIAIAIITIILSVLRLIIGYAVEVGGTKFFLRASLGETDIGYLLYGFKNKRYANILKTMFTRDLYLFFWTLLFIIPGIIKSYSYRMVPYILADNPNIDRKRAIQLSRDMTDGQKATIWGLDLSFIGWYILGFFALVIGILFVLPYENATHAELYNIVREDAILNGLTTREELNI